MRRPGVQNARGTQAGARRTIPAPASRARSIAEAVVLTVAVVTASLPGSLNRVRRRVARVTIGVKRPARRLSWNDPGILRTDAGRHAEQRLRCTEPTTARRAKTISARIGPAAGPVPTSRQDAEEI